MCNRDAATVECPPKVVFTIEPPPKESLLKGIPAVPVQRKFHQPLVFGRANGVDIFLHDDKASRHHMKLFVPSGVTASESPFVVETISKSQPVYINGQPLRTNEQKLLQTGDKLKIAQLTFTVQIESGDSLVSYEAEFVQLSVGRRDESPNGYTPRMAHPQVPHGPFTPVQPHEPPHQRYTPLASPSADERRAIFHEHKQPSENSDVQRANTTVRVPVQETLPHK